MIRQALVLLIVSTVFGLGVNLVSPNKIDYIGQYRSLHTGEGPVVPPAAMEGDPPFIDINLAQLEFATKSSLFVDARDLSEWECGTIPGAVDVPFEGLPEGELGPYLDSALTYAPKDKAIIIFCSGEECDLSLMLGRLLQKEGYTNLSIFFGGAREWEKAGFEMERRQKCGG